MAPAPFSARLRICFSRQSVQRTIGSTEDGRAIGADRDPSVAEFDLTANGKIEVVTHASGEVRLEVRDPTDLLIDALPIVVKPVSTIESTPDSGTTLMLGGTQSTEIHLIRGRATGSRRARASD
jgi:hypothetical protein